ncbi:MAG: hypothetical protein EBU93_04755, partial [Chlamydiae bacterium]|nr:hypothetical protein [Chlamydiota bacterium]
LLCPSLTYSFDFFATFKNGKKGDYIVLSLNKTYTCLSIFDKSQNRLVIEEITHLQSKVTSEEAKNKFENLKDIASHTLFEIDLESKECLICFDLIKGHFLNPKSIDPILLRLFQLEFKPMKKDERRKVGVLDISATIDNRPIWNPTYHFNGSITKGHTCEGFRAIIPQDIQFIGGKFFEIYLDPLLKDFCFPVWLQIADGAQSFKMIPLDMGKGFKSQVSILPRPLPYFSNHFKVSTLIEIEIETTYPIDSHRFFYYQQKPLEIFTAIVEKVEKISGNRFKIYLKKPPQKNEEYHLYTTSELDKNMLVEAIQVLKIIE